MASVHKLEVSGDELKMIVMALGALQASLERSMRKVGPSSISTAFAGEAARVSALILKVSSKELV